MIINEGRSKREVGEWRPAYNISAENHDTVMVTIMMM